MRNLLGIFLAVAVLNTGSFAQADTPSNADYCIVNFARDLEDIIQYYFAGCSNQALSRRSKIATMFASKKTKQKLKASITDKLVEQGYQLLPLKPDYSREEIYRKAANPNEGSKQICMVAGRKISVCSQGVSLPHDVLSPVKPSELLLQNGFRLVSSIGTDFHFYER